MTRKSIPAVDSSEKQETLGIELGEFLDSKGCSEFLASLGLKMSKATLDCAVTRGNSPPYVRFNKRRYYRKSDVVSWVREQTGVSRASSSERRA
jgi:hypothetical protein